MAVSLPCYTSREEVMSALDFGPGQRETTLVDRAIQAATNDVYGLCHRWFYPEDATRYFDWPNQQGAYPWRIWFGPYDLVAATSVTSGGVSIPLGEVFFEPSNKKPDEPFTYLELDRAGSAAFGLGPTPQRDVAITGTWGYTAAADPAGQLAAAVTTAGQATVTVSDSSVLGVGDVITVDAERMLVTDRAMTSTGVAFTGLTSAQVNDNLLPVPDPSVFAAGEVLLLDAERVYVSDVAGTNLVVARGWQGTALAAHTSGTIYAARQLSVQRGALGTAASAHANGAAVSRHRPPALITELAIALAENSVLQKTSGYARTVGADGNVRAASGAGLADLVARACARYGRKARIGVI